MMTTCNKFVRWPRPTSNPIDHFELRCKNAADQHYSPQPFERFQATSAGLALALDCADLRRLELLGRFGPGSSAIVYAIRNTEFVGAERFLKSDVVPVGADHLFNDDSNRHLSEERADELLVLRGELDDEDLIKSLAVTVWNGSDYVNFVPSRCRELYDME